MKTYACKFPGDPICTVHEMTRAEFLQACPREPIRITDEHGTVEIPVGPDEIQCDGCGEDPDDLMYLVDDRRVYCKPCFDKWLGKYRVGEG